MHMSRRRLAFNQLADGVLDDVVYDVGRPAVDAAGFSDFGLFLDLCLMACCQTYHLAEELFVDLAEDVRGQDREFVGAVRVVEAADCEG